MYRKASNCTVTEKGWEYAVEQDHHLGTAGYTHYNRYWISRTWDNGITDELDITKDKKKEIQQEISIAKQKIKESADTDMAV